MAKVEGERRYALDLGLALIISAWIHILAFAFLRYLPPFPTAIKNPPSVMEVEIDMSSFKRSPPEELQKKADKVRDNHVPPASRSHVSEVESPVNDTLSLESKEPEYLSYRQQIKKRIENHWIFPDEAVKKNLSGRLVAVLTLRNDGKLLDASLDTSSGHKLLDREALRAMHRAAPYPPFPDYIKLKRFSIRVIFNYRFQYSTVK